MAEVIIDLKNKPDKDHTPKEYDVSSTGGGNVTIKVTESSDPTPDFLRYTHKDKKSDGSQPFQLSKILDDSGDEINVTRQLKGQEVTSVSAYYWNNDSDNPTDPPTKVLLIGITKGDGTETTQYYSKDRNAGKDWIELEQLSKDGGLLEKTLDDLNCQRYHAVTLDLTRSNSEGHASGKGTQYCCDYHKDKGKITVSEVPVHHHHSSSRITAYRHSIDGGQLAKIKYYENGLLNSEKHRRRITAPELKFPIPGSLSVHAFYCTGNDPVLIYVNSLSNSSVTGWYKKPTNSSSGKDENWEKVQDELSKIRPEDISNNCDNWNKVVEVLKKLKCGLKECEERATQQETLARSEECPDEELKQEVKEAEGEGSAAPVPDEPKTDAPEEPGGGETPTQAGFEKLIAAIGGASGLGYILTGVFGGSGAVGLAGVEACPWSISLWLLAVDLHMEIGDYAKARALVETAKSKIRSLVGPSIKKTTNVALIQTKVLSAAELLKIAKIAMDSDDDDEVVKEMIEKIMSNCDLIWLKGVQIELEATNSSTAYFAMSKALQELPDSGLLWSFSIFMEEKAARDSKAADALKRCPNSPDVVLAAARLFWDAKKVVKARKWFQRAISMDNSNGVVWGTFVAFEIDCGDEASIKEAINNCTKAEPNRGYDWCRIVKRVENWSISYPQKLYKYILEYYPSVLNKSVPEDILRVLNPEVKEEE